MDSLILARGSAATAEMDCYEALNEQQVDLAQQLKALVAEEVQVGRWHAHGDCCGWVAPGGVVRRGNRFLGLDYSLRSDTSPLPAVLQHRM